MVQEKENGKEKIQRKEMEIYKVRERGGRESHQEKETESSRKRKRGWEYKEN